MCQKYETYIRLATGLYLEPEIWDRIWFLNIIDIYLFHSTIVLLN